MNFEWMRIRIRMNTCERCVTGAGGVYSCTLEYGRTWVLNLVLVRPTTLCVYTHTAQDLNLVSSDRTKFKFSTEVLASCTRVPSIYNKFRTRRSTGVLQTED
jgi:hypothetical protein